MDGKIVEGRSHWLRRLAAGEILKGACFVLFPGCVRIGRVDHRACPCWRMERLPGSGPVLSLQVDRMLELA